LGLSKHWQGDYFVIAWKAWAHGRTIKAYGSIPLLICWGLWIKRNNAIFQGKTTSLGIIASKVIVIFSILPQLVKP